MMKGRRSKSKNPAGVAGSLLLAHPALKDPNFQHAVILMSEHDEEGAMGVVLNHPEGRKLGALNGDFAVGPLAQVPIFRGGPVQDRQLILVAWEIRDEGFRLHFGIEPDKAGQCLADGMEVRAFLGYSGWSAGQLEHELKHNTWVVADIPEDIVQPPHDKALWRRVLAAQGDEWRLLAEEPDDNSLN